VGELTGCSRAWRRGGIVTAALVVLLAAGCARDNAPSADTHAVAQLRSAFDRSQATSRAALTARQIERTTDDEALVDRTEGRLLARCGQTQWMEARISLPAREFLAMGTFEEEWLNGGVAQFVINTSDDTKAILAAAASGYRRIGVPVMAQVATNVLQVVVRERRLLATVHQLPDAAAQLERYEQSTRVNTFDGRLRETIRERASYIRTRPDQFAG
jgi:hypothetical protein